MQEISIQFFVAEIERSIKRIRESGKPNAEGYADIASALLVAYLSSQMIDDIKLVTIFSVLLPTIDEYIVLGGSWVLDELATTSKLLFDTKIKEIEQSSSNQESEV